MWWGRKKRSKHRERYSGEWMTKRCYLLNEKWTNAIPSSSCNNLHLSSSAPPALGLLHLSRLLACIGNVYIQKYPRNDNKLLQLFIKLSHKCFTLFNTLLGKHTYRNDVIRLHNDNEKARESHTAVKFLYKQPLKRHFPLLIYYLFLLFPFHSVIPVTWAITPPGKFHTTWMRACAGGSIKLLSTTFPK